jgi:hypothetical protein
MFGALEGPRPLASKKSHLFLVPIDTQGFSKSCFNLIGAGAVLCVLLNCTVAHHGRLVIYITPGDVFMCKSTMEVFIVEPRMSSNSINEEALKDWESLSFSFEAWSNT